MNDDSLEANVKSVMSMDDESALKNQREGNFVRIMNNTPDVILENVTDAKNLEIIIPFDSLYLETRQSGVLTGNYHNLGNLMLDLPEFISNPDAILRMDNGRLNLLTILNTKKGKNGILSIELNSVKDINNKNNKYNVVITVFSASNNYTKNNIFNHAIKTEYKKEDLSQVNPQLYEWLATINDKSFNNSIPTSPQIVNSKNEEISEIDENSEDKEFSYASENARRAAEQDQAETSETEKTDNVRYLPRAGEEISEEDRMLPRTEFEAAKPKKRKYTEDGKPIYFNMTPSERRAARKKHMQMHRTIKDNNLKVRALRRARELREVSASLFFLAFFLFTAVHSTIKPPLNTIMVENRRR